MGLGLATLFRKACHDKSCLAFNGPVISEVDGKTYQFGEYCYKYDLLPTKCDPVKRTVTIDDGAAKVVRKEQEDEEARANSLFSFLGM